MSSWPPDRGWVYRDDGNPRRDLPVMAAKGQRILLRKTGVLPKVVVYSFSGTFVPQADGTLIAAAPSIASGHDATGIMLSAAIGELMADYIGIGDEKVLESFGLERFGRI